MRAGAVDFQGMEWLSCQQKVGKNAMASTTKCLASFYGIFFPVRHFIFLLLQV